MKRIALLLAILGGVVAVISLVPVRSTQASGGENILMLDYTMNDRGGLDVADIRKEKKEMMDDLNEAERNGWRVKGYAMHAVNLGTEHHILMEKTK